MTVERLGPLPQLPTEVRAGAGANDGDAARDRYTVDLLRCLTEWRARLVQLTDDVNSGGGGGGGGGTQETQEITTPGAGSFTVPAGVSAVWVTAVGAGAGGQTSGATVAGGGGGAGEQISGFLYAVTPAGTVAYTVGAKGATDANGAATTFGTLSARGGLAGATAGRGGVGGGVSGGAGGAAANPGGAGLMGLASASLWFCGSGGGGAGNVITAPGGDGGGAGGRINGGAGGAVAASKSGGGGGAASVYGRGGTGGAGGAVGVAAAATAYGAGGGGGGGGTFAGGAGADGYLLLSWIE